MKNILTEKYLPLWAKETVLRHTRMPAILNEGAFVDNKKDIADWNEAHELKRLGIAYGKAAAEYLKLEKRKPEVEVCLPVLSTGVRALPSARFSAF